MIKLGRNLVRFGSCRTLPPLNLSVGCEFVAFDKIFFNYCIACVPNILYVNHCLRL